MAPAAGIRAWPKAGRDYERWGRWPRDVASTAEPGRAVLRCHASGAGKPTSAPPPAFPSLEPGPKFVPPVSSCFSKAFAEGRL